MNVQHDENSEQAVRNAVLNRFAADVGAGAVRALADYQQEHPGFEGIVAEELASLLAPADPVGALRHIGHYEVRRELGSGGQATVYLAHDPRLHRDVALKVLPRGTASVGAELRLQHEATTAARLDDSGICPIYEVGRDGEHLFLAMKYVAGETLAQRIARERALGSTVATSGDQMSLAALLQFFEQLARTLHRAHEAGVVHRDLKPANIMVDEKGAPILLDFGLASLTDGEGTGLTRTGDVFGTPHYLPPERLDGRRTSGDGQGDIWAFGVTLFEALTLRRPFEAPTLEQLFRVILHDEPPPLRSLRPDASRDLAAVLGVCLDKDLRRRYRSALDVAEDLRAARLAEPVRARRPGPLQALLRWHRRHAVVATAGWLVFAGLMSTITVQQQALSAVRAAQAETDGLNEFLVRKMLLAVTPDQARGRAITAEEVFDQAMRNVQSSFAEPSRTSGTVQHVLGLANRALGRNLVARDCMVRAVETRIAVLGPAARETLQSQLELAELEAQCDALPAAERRSAEVLAALRRQFGAADPDALSAQIVQAHIALLAGKHDLAEQLARAAVEACRAVVGERDRRSVNASAVHARALAACGRRAEAEPVLRKVLALRTEVLGADAPAVSEALNDLASLLHDLALLDGIAAKWDEARVCYEQATEYSVRVHGKKSQDYAIKLNGLASFLQDRARLEKSPALLARAIDLFRESLALREAIDGPESTRVATAAMNLGVALCDAEDFEGALPQLTRSFHSMEKTLGRLHPEVVRGLFNLTMVTVRAKAPAAARELIADVSQRLQECPGIDRKTRLVYRHGLLQVRLRDGEHTQVLEEGARLYTDCKAEWRDGGPTGRRVAELLGDAAARLGDTAAAARWRELAVEAR